MIITLTPNPALDITYRIPRLAPGESHRVTDVVERAGGKGLNTAGVLTSMGRRVVALAPVGVEGLARFGADLESRSIPHRLVEAPGVTRRSIAVVDESGVATLLNEAGHAMASGVWQGLVDEVQAAAPQARVLTVSGSLPPEAPDDLVRSLVRVAREAGLRTVLDVSGPPLVECLADRPDVVKPNRGEAAASLGGRSAATPSAGELALALSRAGARAAVVSDGAAGLFLSCGDVHLRAHLSQPLRGNATGAGDAATAALAADLDDAGAIGAVALDEVATETWSEVLRRAVAWSAAAVLQPVAGVIDRDDVDRLLPTVEIEEIHA
ncbi:hexose kinase [Intrasporangium sp. DVR]|uniref:1-phosphofructokinase family hexose kinase n=1 Tax=Intrasporangium sp. DVR TaxID=3127867 RepID=UPI00313A6D85